MVIAMVSYQISFAGRQQLNYDKSKILLARIERRIKGIIGVKVGGHGAKTPQSFQPLRVFQCPPEFFSVSQLIF